MATSTRWFQMGQTDSWKPHPWDISAIYFGYSHAKKGRVSPYNPYPHSKEADDRIAPPTRRVSYLQNLCISWIGWWVTGVFCTWEEGLAGLTPQGVFSWGLVFIPFTVNLHQCWRASRGTSQESMLWVWWTELARGLSDTLFWDTSLGRQSSVPTPSPILITWRANRGASQGGVLPILMSLACEVFISVGHLLWGAVIHPPNLILTKPRGQEDESLQYKLQVWHPKPTVTILPCPESMNNEPINEQSMVICASLSPTNPYELLFSQFLSVLLRASENSTYFVQYWLRTNNKLGSSNSWSPNLTAWSFLFWGYTIQQISGTPREHTKDQLYTFYLRYQLATALMDKARSL